MRKKNIIMILVISASVMLSACKENIKKQEETPEELTLTDKKIDFWNGEYAYEIRQDGEVWLTNVEGEDSQDGASKEIKYATIPEKVTYRMQEYVVTGIGSGSFRFCYNLREVILPDTIREIKINAFSACENLTNINFPEQIERIEEGAFAFVNISEVVLPQKAVLIESGAFSYCDNITKIELSESVEKIESCAFIGCSKLSEVVISAKELEIGQEAFAECESLKTFYVPKERLEYYQGVLSEYDAEVKTIEE